METVLVHLPESAADGPESPARTLPLCPGQKARFGRGIPECPVDIALPDPAVPRLAGEILAVDVHWQLSNLSGASSLLVENPEGAGEFIRIPPRRLAAPIPFEFSRVVLATRGGTVGFQVFAPCHSHLETTGESVERGTVTTAPFALDSHATYFRVLVALCEPRLRDASTAGVPSTASVVARLRPHPEYRQLSTSAVDFHIDYLAGTKLRLRPPGPGAAGLSWKRETLVSTALRFGLVGEDHLSLLPPRRTSARARPTGRAAAAEDSA
ncbi:serine/threonine protein kinase [Streptomyces sp. KMM 9044]|uniref:serine/threonine protein kinase n=1 Tax=Streptomyces sp. KMM 9044 TaxID=2744474 RepID=UPI002150F2C8|nr:serine/threonine protein kinase [Streptomyces sp. KMM 9044]WAX78995.1 serine/threonine protein kinase [Streptomyces sp. KMM 9044]